MPDPSNPASTPLRGLLGREPSIVTAGIGLLADALRAQAAQVTEVDWRPRVRRWPAPRPTWPR
jgi:hypothetical protein